MKRNKPKPENKQPTVKFCLMFQTWFRIGAACRKDGFDAIADSITRHIAGRRPTDLFEISVPLTACIAISQACANHSLGVGISFATAASSLAHEKQKEEPVDPETLAMVREEFEETEADA
jgi:hypothetical protein